MARFVSIAGVYDALRSRRLHKPALSRTSAVEIMTETTQGQFDPMLLQVFQTCSNRWDQVFNTNPD